MVPNRALAGKVSLVERANVCLPVLRYAAVAQSIPVLETFEHLCKEESFR